MTDDSIDETKDRIDETKDNIYEKRDNKRGAAEVVGVPLVATVTVDPECYYGPK